MPIHPTRKLNDYPEIYEFAARDMGTYPPWFDPSYWYKGVTPRFKGKLQAKMFVANVAMELQTVVESGAHVACAAIILALLAYDRRRWTKAVGRLWFIWLPGAIALPMFALVHVEPRFLGGFAERIVTAHWKKIDRTDAYVYFFTSSGRPHTELSMQTYAPSDLASPSRNRSVIRRWTGCSGSVLVLYVNFCAALAVAGYLRPLPTYDRFFYAGVIASFRYSDPITVHRIARAEFDSQPSPFSYESVAHEPYFADMRDNPYHFKQQLGFYRVKVAYVAIGYALWRAGLPILVGLRLISASCMFALGLIVLVWTHDALLSAVLLLTPPVLNMGRTVTVDPLSTVIVLLALFAFARRKDLLAASFLMASLLIRFDNVVLLLVILAWMAWKRRIRLSFGTIFGALAVIATVSINRITGYYGWRVLMQHSFIKPEIEPVNHPILISFTGYLHALTALRVMPYTFMTIWLLVAAAVWKRLPLESAFRYLLPLAGISILVRLAIVPDIEDRYFVWAYLLAGIALIQTARSEFAQSARHCTS